MCSGGPLPSRRPGHENDDLAIIYLFAQTKEELLKKHQELARTFPSHLKDKAFKATEEYSVYSWYFGNKKVGQPEKAPDDAHRYMTAYAFYERPSESSCGKTAMLADFLKVTGCTEDPVYSDIVLTPGLGGYHYYGGYKPRWAFVLG